MNYSSISNYEIIYLASSFAVALSQGLTCSEISLLASFLVAVGDNLALLSIQCAETNES